MTREGMRGIQADGRLLKIREFATRAGVSVVTTYRWAAERRIGSVKLGRSIRIPEAELERLFRDGHRPARLDDEL